MLKLDLGTPFSNNFSFGEISLRFHLHLKSIFKIKIHALIRKLIQITNQHLLNEVKKIPITSMNYFSE